MAVEEDSQPSHRLRGSYGDAFTIHVHHQGGELLVRVVAHEVLEVEFGCVARHPNASEGVDYRGSWTQP